MTYERWQLKEVKDHKSEMGLSGGQRLMKFPESRDQACLSLGHFKFHSLSPV